MNDPNQKKLVVVTGGAGFIGSHLCERLVREGHRVISLDNYFTGSSENHVPGVEYREGHTADIERLVPETPDLIYHLGEYARVEQSVFEAEIVENLNTRGTRGVIEFWRKRAGKLVYAGSSTKFGDGGAARHTSPYARTKAENSELVKAVGEKEKLPYAVVYFYNVFGPRERSGIYGTVIEQFKRMYASGAPLAIVRPGTQERNFTHVNDIVDALIAVGEKGSGDEYGLGNETAHSILAVARLFGFSDDDVVFFPERRGNRRSSSLDTAKTRCLGWEPRRALAGYIGDFIRAAPRGAPREKRVLVFSTTFAPVSGLAEDALLELARELPDVHFDVVTTRFVRRLPARPPLPNITLHRIGIGFPLDKFLLPLWGGLQGARLARRHAYLFAWSIMASYGALAALFSGLFCPLPLLITLADQSLDSLGAFRRAALSLLLSRADQVYGSTAKQERRAKDAARAALPRRSLGEGDAFGNALRFAYADVIARSIV